MRSTVISERINLCNRDDVLSGTMYSQVAIGVEVYVNARISIQEGMHIRKESYSVLI